MGSRYLTVVQHRGEYKVAQFGQFEGHAEGAGLAILNFLREILSDPEKFSNFERGLDASEFITDDSAITLLTEFAPLVPNPDLSWMPHLLGEFGCRVLHKLVKRGSMGLHLPLLNHLEFAANGLFCGKAYVIDLDARTFEVYEGGRGATPPGERFSDLPRGSSPNLPPTDPAYGPVRLLQKWGFDDLPSDETFVSICGDEE